MEWGEAAQVAQVFAVLITAVGIIVSLMIGIKTLRELRAERLHRMRPIFRFPNGGQRVPITLSDSNFLPGFDPKFALTVTANRPKGDNRLDATSSWGKLTNYGSGAAFDTRIRFLYYRIFVGNDCFVVDLMKRQDFPYAIRANEIPASPSHLPPGEAAIFRRLDASKNRLDASKNRLFLITNCPLLGWGDAGDRGWRGNRDFSTATSD